MTNLDSASSFIKDCIRQRKKTYICVAPVSTVLDVQASSVYENIVNNAGMVTPDGMPLVWVGKWKGAHDIKRTYGPDLMLTVCEQGREKRVKHFFYGGTEKNNRLLVSRLRERFSDLNIVGNIAPPLREIGEIEDPVNLAEINQSDPDILWVGLGSPKQDYWMYNHRDKLNVPVMIGVGAAFDFLAGVKKQAPRWMRNAGLEWLFRLCSEPKRLWRRYLVGNTKFMFLLARHFIKVRFGNKA